MLTAWKDYFSTLYFYSAKPSSLKGNKALWSLIAPAFISRLLADT